MKTLLPSFEQHFESFDPPIPIQGLWDLARFWAGGGSLFEWLGPPNDDRPITVAWSTTQARARTAQALLLHLEQTVCPYLPFYASDWLNLLEQQIYRLTELTEAPTAHTDWTATIAEYGQYPTPLYVERKPRGTFDTPLTRTLKWLCIVVARAEELVFRTFGHRPLTEKTRLQFRVAAELPEVESAADEGELDTLDSLACVDFGGSWALIGEAARRFGTLWSGTFEDQLLRLTPILPGLSDKLFELAVMGAVTSTVRDEFPDGLWRTRTPIAAARAGIPCIETETLVGSWSCFYQTTPEPYRSAMGPYRTLTQPLGGNPLRPDIWLISTFPPEPTELVLECKYSPDGGYVASGVPQVLAYWEEFEPASAASRVHMVVGPETVIASAKSFDARFAIGTPTNACELVEAVCRGDAMSVLTSWS